MGDSRDYLEETSMPLPENWVEALQKSLNANGEGLKVDGIMGTKTNAALKKYEVSFLLARKAPPPPIDSRDITPALEMIKPFEGLYLDAYLDAVLIPTIGYGTIRYPNGARVKMGEKCTEAQAEEWLIWECAQCRDSIRDMVQVSINNNQLCALVSFCHNLGAGSLKNSTLLAKLNSGQPKPEIADEFDKWVNAGGHPLKGLIRRRAAEKALFLA